MEKLRFADFNGDGKTDVFFDAKATANGSQLRRHHWLEEPQQIRRLLEKLRFADFNGDGKTDVFYRHESDGQWRYSSGATTS